MDEGRAIARLKRGDIAGLETLVARYQVAAVHAAYLITRDYALAEDIVQSAFIRVYEARHTFDEARPFGPWFYRIVTNDAARATGQRRRFLALDASWDGVQGNGEPGRWSIDPQLGPEALVEATETRQELWAAMEQLSPTQRQAIVLRYFLDLDVSEVAERLNMAGGTAKWHLHTARKRLAGLVQALRPGTGTVGNAAPSTEELALQADVETERPR